MAKTTTPATTRPFPGRMPPGMPNPFGKLQYGSFHQLTPSCYIFRNIVNSGVVITEAGVAVVDTQINEPMARRLLAAIRRVTDGPIRYAINTHYHWDHWAGNNVLRQAGATLICGALTRHFMEVRNRRQRAFLQSRGFSLPSDDAAKPEVTFEGELTLRLGNVPLHLLFLGRAETDDATAVWVPTERCAMSGDTLMTGSFPILGQPVMNEGLSEDRAWIKTLERLKGLGPERIIPGHGNPGGVAEIDFFIELQAYFLDAVAPLLEAGLPPHTIIERVEAELPERYANLPEVWGTPRYAILRVLHSMTGWQQVKPSALPEARPGEVEAALAALEPAASRFVEAAQKAEPENPGLALAIMDAAVREFPDDPLLWVQRGQFYLQGSRQARSVLERGDYFIEVRRSAERALACDPDCGPGFILLGSYLAMGAYRNGDDPAEAMAYLSKALRTSLSKRDEAKVHCYLGLCYRAREDEAAARASFEKALELDPSYMPARLAMLGGQEDASNAPGACQQESAQEGNVR